MNNTDLKNTILSLEKKLLSPEVRGSAELLNGLLSEDFIETGVSGRKYLRSDVIELLAKEQIHPQLTITNFEIIEFSESFVLATYRTENKASGAVAMRRSVWEKKRLCRWQMRFHHGTRSPPDLTV